MYPGFRYGGSLEKYQHQVPDGKASASTSDGDGDGGGAVCALTDLYEGIKGSVPPVVVAWKADDKKKKKKDNNNTKDNKEKQVADVGAGAGAGAGVGLALALPKPTHLTDAPAMPQSASDIRAALQAATATFAATGGASAADAIDLTDDREPGAPVVESGPVPRWLLQFADEGAEWTDAHTLRCSVCDVEVTGAWPVHVNSVPHQLARHTGGRGSLVEISRANRGYQMLERLGWKEDDGVGLGKHGDGRIGPVPTTLKRNRRGIGSKPAVDPVTGKPAAPRVSHFVAHDEAQAQADPEGLSVAQKQQLALEGRRPGKGPPSKKRSSSSRTQRKEARRRRKERRLELELDPDLSGPIDLHYALALPP